MLNLPGETISPTINTLRLLLIADLIVQKDRTPEELAARFGISKRQLGRDIKFIRLMGADICVLRKKVGETMEYIYHCANSKELTDSGKLETWIELETAKELK